MSQSIQRVAPILPVRDVALALTHYRRLSFEGQAYAETDAAGPVYGFLKHGAVEVHLARVGDLDPQPNTSACYLHVSDANALHAAWQALGITSGLRTPTATPYGLREFAYVDPDCNLLGRLPLIALNPFGTIRTLISGMLICSTGVLIV